MLIIFFMKYEQIDFRRTKFGVASNTYTHKYSTTLSLFQSVCFSIQFINLMIYKAHAGTCKVFHSVKKV